MVDVGTDRADLFVKQRKNINIINEVIKHKESGRSSTAKKSIAPH